MTAEYIETLPVDDIEAASAMTDWFGDYVFGFSEEIGDIPKISRRRLLKDEDKPNDEQVVFAHLRESILSANEEMQQSVAMYICGFPDETVETLGGKAISTIENYLFPKKLPTAPVSTTRVRKTEPKLNPSRPTIDSKTDLDTGTQNKDSVGMYVDDMRRTGKLLNAEQEVELSKRIEAGLAAAAILGSELDWLGGAKRDELEWLAKDGENAKNEFIEKNVRLVFSIARRHQYRVTQSYKMADIISDGNLGLIRAVEKFDFTKGFKFSTYATSWIRQSITRGAYDASNTVRIPVHALEEINSYKYVVQNLNNKFGYAPSDEEICQEMDITSKKLSNIREAMKKQPRSLNQKLDEDGDTEFGDLIGGDDGRDMFTDVVIHSANRDHLLKIISDLPEREAEIILRRFGFYGKTETLEEVGQRFGIVSERVRQIENEIFEKLRQAIVLDDGGELVTTEIGDVVLPPKIKHGRKRSYDPGDLIEKGKDIVSEKELRVLETLQQVENIAEAAELLGYKRGSIYAMIATIKKKIADAE